MLEGVRVVELGTYVAVPGACALLASWGADVIKVESPTGDPFRMFFASVGRDDTRNAVFDTDNHDKRSIVIDIAAAEGADKLRRLLQTADVFVTNVRAASLDRIGLGWDGLSSMKLDLIVAHLTGYGSEGPDAARPGFDSTALWARSGLCSVMSIKGDDPVVLRTGIGDHIASLGLAGAVCAALVHRARTGKGQRIDTSLLRFGAYAGSCEHAVQLQTGRLASTKRRPEAANPLNNYFRTADGQWFVVIPRQGAGDWPRFAAAVGRPELLRDERFGGVRARRANGANLVRILDEAFAAMTFEEAAAALTREGLVWERVATIAQAQADPQFRAAGCFAEVVGADGESFEIIAPPLDFSGRSGRTMVRAPALDEHGAEISRELAAT